MAPSIQKRVPDSQPFSLRMTQNSKKKKKRKEKNPKLYPPWCRHRPLHRGVVHGRLKSPAEQHAKQWGGGPLKVHCCCRFRPVIRPLNTYTHPPTSTCVCPNRRCGTGEASPPPSSGFEGAAGKENTRCGCILSPWCAAANSLGRFSCGRLLCRRFQ